MNVTGRIRFRQSWTRSFVLQAEYEFMTASLSYVGPNAGRLYPHREWRDATASDVADLVAMGVLPSRKKLPDRVMAPSFNDHNSILNQP